MAEERNPLPPPPPLGSEHMGTVAVFPTAADIQSAVASTVGSSLVEEDKLDLATSLLEKAKAKGVSLLLPTDVVIADKFAPDANCKTVPLSVILDGWMGLDIGPDSIKTFTPPKYIDCEVKKTVMGDKGEISFEYETLTENNPEYEVWLAHDQSLVAYITSTLSEEVLGGIDDDLTALELWSTRATTYSQVSEARFLQLRRQFQDIKRVTRIVLEYLNEIKSVSDQLAAIGHPVSDKDKVQQALSGLGPEFDIFCTALEVLPVLPSFEDLKAKLFQHETSRVQRQNLIPSNNHNVLITGTHALQGNHTRPWTS
ncbi:Phosphoglycerate kinase [Nymphaea thermarum]|nr:Phosphoglycerate kinase [Nymphaea thermarum]